MRSAFKQLPRAVMVVFFIFLCVPLFSLWGIGLPWDTFHYEGFWKGTLVLLGYWCLPVALCYAILSRHYLFLPLYFSQCIVLIVHALVYFRDLPIDMLCVRCVMIGMMAYIGVLFGDRDFLYPFTTRASRSWRRSPRVQVHFNVLISAPQHELKIPAVMENCSQTGIAITVAKTYLLSQLPRVEKGDILNVTVPWMGREHHIPTEIAWASAGTPQNFGLHAVDSETMAGLMSEITKHLPEAVSPAGLIERDMHQTAIALWVIFIIASFAMPVFAGM